MWSEEAPVDPEYVPAGQSEQASILIDPVSKLYVPAKQSIQAEEFEVDQLPASQVVQAVEADDENAPAEQVEQPLALVAPVVALYVPATHGTQLEALLAPVFGR